MFQIFWKILGRSTCWRNAVFSFKLFLLLSFWRVSMLLLGHSNKHLNHHLISSPLVLEDYNVQGRWYIMTMHYWPALFLLFTWTVGTLEQDKASVYTLPANRPACGFADMWKGTVQFSMLPVPGDQSANNMQLLSEVKGVIYVPIIKCSIHVDTFEMTQVRRYLVQAGICTTGHK